MPRWPSSRVMAQNLANHIGTNVPGVAVGLRQLIEDSLADRFANDVGFRRERTHSRLAMRLFEKMEAGGFGPLFEADGVTRTSMGQFMAEYNLTINAAFLDQFDEEGNLL